MDRFLYIKLVEQQLKAHFDQLYGDVDVIWQDDGDSKHRFHYALEKIDEIFNDRVTADEQADKMTDIWLLENIWGYIKEKLKGEEIKNISMLKNKIIETSRTISPQMCSKLMNSIPRRSECLINKESYSVNKKDYKDL
ncbi:unnamed protein product [Rotaria sp. Silwood1]|nr:unnamed protein product [Rotaria sp. Silwood1]